MHIIARLVRAALEACFQHGKINWLPAGSYGMPASFIAECEIEFQPSLTEDSIVLFGDYHVTMLNVLCLVGLEDVSDDRCTHWHSEVLEVAE